MRTLLKLIILACIICAAWGFYKGVIDPSKQKTAGVDSLINMGVSNPQDDIETDRLERERILKEKEEAQNTLYTFYDENEKEIEEVFVDGSAQHNYADITGNGSKQEELEDSKIERKYILNAEQKKKFAALEKKYKAKRMTKDELFTDLMDAVYFNDIPKIMVLIDKGASPDSTERNTSFTPIFMAISNGGVNTLAMLLEKGASFDIYDEKGFTPLHRAVTKVDYNGTDPYPAEEIIEVLLENGMDINQTTRKGGITPLMTTAQEHEGNIMQYLVDNGANPNAVDDEGLTALDYAKRFECTACLRVLLN